MFRPRTPNNSIKEAYLKLLSECAMSSWKPIMPAFVLPEIGRKEKGPQEPQLNQDRLYIRKEKRSTGQNSSYPSSRQEGAEKPMEM